MIDVKTINLIIKDNGDIPQIGEYRWFKYKGQTIYGFILSIESVEYDKRRKLNIVYRISVTERKGMQLVKG